MEYLPYTLKWLELLLRWGHVLFAILWVGNSFLFNYLDNKLNKNISSEDIDGEGYLMHSGFYYKLTRLKKSPPITYLNQLVIFKWQSYLTFISGMLLLAIIFSSLTITQPNGPPVLFALFSESSIALFINLFFVVI